VITDRSAGAEIRNWFKVEYTRK